MVVKFLVVYVLCVNSVTYLMLKIALSYCILFRPDCLSSLGGLLFSEGKERESGPGGGGGGCWDEWREGKP